MRQLAGIRFSTTPLPSKKSNARRLRCSMPHRRTRPPRRRPTRVRSLGFFLPSCGEEHHALLVELHVLHAASSGCSATERKRPGMMLWRMTDWSAFMRVDEARRGQAQPLDGACAGARDRRARRTNRSWSRSCRTRATRAVDGIQHVLRIWERTPKRPRPPGSVAADEVHAVQAQHLLVQVDLARQGRGGTWAITTSSTSSVGGISTTSQPKRSKTSRR